MVSQHRCDRCGVMVKSACGGLLKHMRSCGQKRLRASKVSYNTVHRLFRATTNPVETDNHLNHHSKPQNYGATKQGNLHAEENNQTSKNSLCIYDAIMDWENGDVGNVAALSHSEGSEAPSYTQEQELRESDPMDGIESDWIDDGENQPVDASFLVQGMQTVWDTLRVVTFEEVCGKAAGSALTPAVPICSTLISSYEPFSSASDYALALWFYKTKQTMESLKIFFEDPLLSGKRKGLSYRSAAQWDKKMHEIPHGIANDKFLKATISTQGLTARMARKKHTIRYRDALSAVKFLLGFAPFRDELTYAPIRQYTPEGSRAYNELHTGDWWWQMQEKLPDGATVVPIILSSDKTMLSQHRGDISVWPVYLTIGNLNSATRRKQTVPGSILLGLIPVVKTKGQSPQVKAEVYHRSMTLMLRSLESYGRNGVRLKCADGSIRLCYPILAAMTVDYEEQVLITGIASASCPTCLVPSKEKGNLCSGPWPQRTHDFTKRLIRKQRREGRDALWVHDVENFAWSHNHVNIHAIMTPDILHQLYKGLLMHLNSWVCELLGKIRPVKLKKGSEREMHQLSGAIQLEHRFQIVPDYQGLHLFKNFSAVKQWTGNEQKAMARQYVAVLAPLLSKRYPAAMLCVRAIVDFITVAQYRVHDDSTLSLMTSALERINVLKIAFAESRPVDEKTQENHFNFPKFHAITHYVDFIRLYGATDGVDTSHSEAAHKYNIKENYSLTNKRHEFLNQMALLNVRRVNILSMQALITQSQLSQNRNSHFQGDAKCKKPTITTMSAAVPLKTRGIAITREEEDYVQTHRLKKGYWCKAVNVERHLKINRFVDALAIFVQSRRKGRCTGLWSSSDNQLISSSWVEGLYVSVHPSLTCRKRSGKNSSNLNEMIEEQIRCTPVWQAKNEWRNDYVWVKSADEEAEDLPLHGRIVGQVKIGITVFDPWYSWQTAGSEIQDSGDLFHCGALIEVLRPLNRGLPNETHGMIEFESWGEPFLRNRSLNPRSMQFHTMSTIIRSAHVVPCSKMGRFYINNYVDWDQYNTLYDPDIREKEHQLAHREAEVVTRMLMERVSARKVAKAMAERKKKRKDAKKKLRSGKSTSYARTPAKTR